MRTYWDDVVRRWERRGSLGRRLLRGTAGHVAALPAPAPRRRSRLVFVVLLIALIVALGQAITMIAFLLERV